MIAGFLAEKHSAYAVAYFLPLNYSMSKCPEVKYENRLWVFLDMTLQEAGSRASFCSLGNQVQKGEGARKPEAQGLLPPLIFMSCPLIPTAQNRARERKQWGL